MGRLTDILGNGEGDRLRAAWGETQSAADLDALPPGRYVARIVSGELSTSRTNSTPGYKLTFRVLEGAHVGRLFWHDLWLTEAALPMTKRDLSKLGVATLEQLEVPLPKGIRCAVQLALRTNDDGTRFNRVRSFDVLGIDPPDEDPFAPAVLAKPPTPPLGDAAEPSGPVAADAAAGSAGGIPF